MVAGLTSEVLGWTDVARGPDVAQSCFRSNLILQFKKKKQFFLI